MATMTKYEKIAAELRDEITTGTLPPSAPIPSEAQLRGRFGVSNDTVRKAVAVLVREGLVTNLHGIGNLVRPRDDRPAHTHTHTVTRHPGDDGEAGAAFTADDGHQWAEVREPARYRMNASADLALTLGIPEHTPLFVCDRLLTTPTGRRKAHRTWLPFTTVAAVPALEADPFCEPDALYTAFSAAGQEPSFTDYVRAKMPTPDDTADLRVPANTPMLLTRRVTRSVSGMVLALEETRLSSQDTQLAFPVAVTPAAPHAG